MGLGPRADGGGAARGYPTASSRRRGSPRPASYLVQATNLSVFAWLICSGLGWPDSSSEAAWASKGVFVVDELTILAPFLVAEVLGWWGLYPAARASRVIGAGSGPGWYLVRKARMAFGMILPAVVLFWAGADLAKASRSATSASAPVKALSFWRDGGDGGAPAGDLPGVRPPDVARGALAERPAPRPARAARRPVRVPLHGTSSLWDTEGSVFNAVVTGALPGYRYILLSDALVDALDEHEIAAVFGHEMGHIRHRHLASFGLFFLGQPGRDGL